MAKSVTVQVWLAPKKMPVLIVMAAGAPVWTLMPSVEAAGVSVRVPLAELAP